MDEITLGARHYTNGPGPQQVRGFFEGDIAEVLVFDRALDAGEADRVQKYLQAKYAAVKKALPGTMPPRPGQQLVRVADPPPVQVLVPGFSVRALPLELSNINNLKYRADGKPFRVDLAPGRRVELPDGLGSIRFDGWQRWVKVQVSDSPGKGVALAGVSLALLGLMGSLFVRRRRAWVRVTERDGHTLVEVAGLDRSAGGEGLDEEVRRLARVVAGPPPLDTGLSPDRPAPAHAGGDTEVER